MSNDRWPEMRPSSSRRPSPVLGAAATTIGAAADHLVTPTSRFAHTFEAPLERVFSDPEQPRKFFGQTALTSLAATMAEQGQLQPVLLRRDPSRSGSWLIVAGERRWRAAKLNDWPSILAIEVKDEDSVGVLALLENLQRVDLTPLEEARGLQRLLAARGWSQARTAAALGKSKGEVSASLKILDLPSTFITDLEDGRVDLPRNTLVELARLPPGASRNALVAAAYAGRLTVKALRAAKAYAEVGTAAEAPSAQEGVKKIQGEALGPAILGRLSHWLESLKTSQRAPTELERNRLVALQATIAEVLGDPKPPKQSRAGRLERS